MARVFVGIPSKDRPEFVKEAVESVIAQSFTDFRLIVSDNCSHPDNAARVEKYIRERGDPRITYVRQPEDKGEYGQGRYFIGQCVEEYFVILHDDDRLEPEHLNFAVGALDRDASVAFLASNQYIIDENGIPDQGRTQEYRRFTCRHRMTEGPVGNTLELVLGTGVFSISGAVFRSQLVKKYGIGDPECNGRWPFEFNVFLRQAENGGRAYFATRALVAYRWHSRQMRKEGAWRFNQQMMGALMEMLERRSFTGNAERRRRWLLAYCYQFYGYILHVAGERRASYRYLARSLMLAPWTWQHWAYAGFAVAFPFLIRPIFGSRVKLTS